MIGTTVGRADNTAFLIETAIKVMNDDEVNRMPLLRLWVLPCLLVQRFLRELSVADGQVVDVQKGQQLLACVIALSKTTRTTDIRPLVAVHIAGLRPHACVEGA